MSTANDNLAEVMNVDEAAKFLGIGRNSLDDACKRHEVPHRRVGRRILFSRSALLRWLGATQEAAGRG